jgi:hypothetical protein
MTITIKRKHRVFKNGSNDELDDNSTWVNKRDKKVSVAVMFLGHGS